MIRNGVNLGKRGFQPTMEQNTVFEKDLYSIREFNEKRNFLQEMVKSWQIALFNPKWRQKQFKKRVLIHELI